ncbi:MAG TPA: hypothetical protein PK200_16175 [Spirochaetota bacterium]|nr:hypothetical protein [Spirochaetota bacterium]HQO03869.1 hypothetical protein [Spirochaetota bacterium]
MEEKSKDVLLTFLTNTKEGKYAEIEESSLEFSRMDIETDTSDEYQEYLYSVR